MEKKAKYEWEMGDKKEDPFDRKGQIKKDEFDEWKKGCWLLYETNSVKDKDGKGKLISFFVHISNKFRVKVDRDVIYEGYSFEQAVEAYEEYPFLEKREGE